MAIYPESLSNLIEQFQKLPTIGKKSAQRLAMSIVLSDEKSVKEFADALIDVKEKIKYCEICGNITEDNLCDICKDITRNEDCLCVVEDINDLIEDIDQALEK